MIKVKDPRALAWSDHERALYIVDAEDSNLVLEKWSADGASETRLWTSGAITELPLRIWLRVAVSGEVVMSMSGIPGVGSEIVIMDPDGTPTGSTAVAQSLALGSELTSGLSIATWVNGQVGSYAGFPRENLSVALCGAPWLRAHRGPGAGNPLAQAVSCN